jgi:hypothetical protein
MLGGMWWEPVSFNSGGKSDILRQNDSGQAAVWLMDGTTLLSGAGVSSSPAQIETSSFRMSAPSSPVCAAGRRDENCRR